jgi:hypothetical protein
VLLWNRCKRAFQDAEKSKELEYLYLNSMLLCAFTIEACLNHLIMHKYPGDWRKYERSHSPDEKLDKLSKICGSTIDKGRRPFQSFKKIFNLRHAIVHAKPEHISEEFDYDLEKFLEPNELPPIPKSAWEKLLTPRDARLFLDHTEEMIDQLFKLCGIVDDPFSQQYSRTEWKGQP